MIEEHNQLHQNDEISKELHLPPIEPATPSVGNARKILMKGASLATKAGSGVFDEVGFSPTSKQLSGFKGSFEAAENPKISMSASEDVLIRKLKRSGFLNLKTKIILLIYSTNIKN